MVELTPQSIRSNAAYWGSNPNVPRRGFTLGLGTMSTAKSIVLLASGAAKAAILERALRGPIHSNVPASVIQNWRCVTVIADRDAAAALRIPSE